MRVVHRLRESHLRDGAGVHADREAQIRNSRRPDSTACQRKTAAHFGSEQLRRKSSLRNENYAKAPPSAGPDSQVLLDSAPQPPGAETALGLLSSWLLGNVDHRKDR